MGKDAPSLLLRQPYDRTSTPSVGELDCWNTDVDPFAFGQGDIAKFLGSGLLFLILLVPGRGLFEVFTSAEIETVAPRFEDYSISSQEFLQDLFILLQDEFD
jgi:hypothetical protein